MAVERAVADLARLDAEAVDLKRRIAEIDRKSDRLRTYIAVAQEYAAPPQTGLGAIHAGPAKGITEAAVEGAIALLRVEGKPIHTRVLLSRLAQQGVTVGGSNPVANLSGFLSRDKIRLRNSRMEGWHLREWDAANARGESEKVGHSFDPFGEDPRDPDLVRDRAIELEAEAAEEERLGGGNYHGEKSKNDHA